MIAVGRFVLLITSFAGMALSDDDRFSNDDINKFLDYIFRLHNAVRYKHDVSPLKRTKEMDDTAYEKMIVLLRDQYFYNDPYEIIYNFKTYSNDTVLSPTEAISFFSLWYEEGNFFNYFFEPDYLMKANFTKIVWRDTKEIGLTFWSDENEYIVLVVYKPDGNNYTGLYNYVLPPRSDRSARDPEIPELFYETETEKFLNYIVELHDRARIAHGVDKLKREIYLDDYARSMLHQKQGNELLEFHYGMNFYEMKYSDNTKLDEAKASFVFSQWYNTRKSSNYNYTPENYKAAPFEQIVCNSTERFGMAIDRTHSTYRIVVFYDPRGDPPEENTSNVFIPQSMDQGESSGNRR